MQIAVDIHVTQQRGQCCECKCVIYKHASVYSCSSCLVSTNKTVDKIEEKIESITDEKVENKTEETTEHKTENKTENQPEYALICSSKVCILKHAMREVHTSCPCKTCFEVRSDIPTRDQYYPKAVYFMDPFCYHCNQKTDSTILNSFTINGQGILQRGHNGKRFTSKSRYLVWCNKCPSPPFDIKPMLFGSRYYYSLKEWPVSVSRNKTIQIFHELCKSQITTPAWFTLAIQHSPESHLQEQLTSFKRIISGELGFVPSESDFHSFITNSQYAKFYYYRTKDALDAYINVIMQSSLPSQFTSLVKYLEHASA